MSRFDDDLPNAYGRSRLVLLAVDPFHVHAYWEMTLNDRLLAREELDATGSAALSRWVLRFYDVTSADWEEERAADISALGHFDVPIQPSARNWYIDLWSAGKTYFVELGLCENDRFVAVCRSNPVNVPRAEPTPLVEVLASFRVAADPVPPPALSGFDLYTTAQPAPFEPEEAPGSPRPDSSSTANVEVISDYAAETPNEEATSTRPFDDFSAGEKPRSRSVSLRARTGSGSAGGPGGPPPEEG